MINLNKLSLSSSASSLKVLDEGTGTLVIPALPAYGDVHGIVTIPHGFASDDLLFQVSTNGGPSSGVMLPWQSNDGRSFQYAYLDSTNLYIVAEANDSAGFSSPSTTLTYFYRILIP
jgi:hypothetical protein